MICILAAPFNLQTTKPVRHLPKYQLVSIQMQMDLPDIESTECSCDRNNTAFNCIFLSHFGCPWFGFTAHGFHLPEIYRHCLKLCVFCKKQKLRGDLLKMWDDSTLWSQFFPQLSETSMHLPKREWLNPREENFQGRCTTRIFLASIHSGCLCWVIFLGIRHAVPHTCIPRTLPLDWSWHTNEVKTTAILISSVNAFVLGITACLSQWRQSAPGHHLNVQRLCILLTNQPEIRTVCFCSSRKVTLLFGAECFSCLCLQKACD